MPGYNDVKKSWKNFGAAFLRIDEPNRSQPWKNVLCYMKRPIKILACRPVTEDTKAWKPTLRSSLVII